MSPRLGAGRQSLSRMQSSTIPKASICKRILATIRYRILTLTDTSNGTKNGNVIFTPEAGRAFTTVEMQGHERDIGRRMQVGRDINVIVDVYTRERTFKQHPRLSLSQQPWGVLL